MHIEEERMVERLCVLFGGILLLLLLSGPAVMRVMCDESWKYFECFCCSSLHTVSDNQPSECVHICVYVCCKWNIFRCNWLNKTQSIGMPIGEPIENWILRVVWDMIWNMAVWFYVYFMFFLIIFEMHTRSNIYINVYLLCRVIRIACVAQLISLLWI